MTEENSQCIRVSSTDGANTVERFLNDVMKRADKGKVEFGVDLKIERVDDPQDVESD